MIRGSLSGDGAIVARFQTLPSAMRDELSASMDRAAFRVQAHVVQDKLSGQVLKRVTGTLASSVNVARNDTATEIRRTIGTKVRYGGVHEFGGTFEVRAYQRRVALVRRTQGPQRLGEVQAHTVTFPERSFLRSGLRDLRSEILGDIRSDLGKVKPE